MNIKRYVGADLKEIVKRIKSDFGNNAVILHNRFVKGKGLFKFMGSKDHFEVVVGSGFKIVKDFQQDGTEKKPAAASPLQKKYSMDLPVPAAATPTEWMRQEIDEIKKLMQGVHTHLMEKKLEGSTEELFDEYLNLTSNLVSEEMARKIVGRLKETLPEDQLRDKAMIRETVRKAITSAVRSSDGIDLKRGSCVRVAFIGPTGVGKTTTIAKLMSIYSIKHKKKVGVITTDTKRIGASDQIKRVAQLVGIPIKVVSMPSEMPAALQELQDCDLVLIDTAGRAQGNAQKMGELKEILRTAQVHETHLVLDVTKNPQTLGDVIEKFSPVEFNKVVLTKLDEAVKVGLVLDVMSKMDKALSFVTLGQEIPRDIEIADSGRLTALILGEQSLAV